MTPEELIKLCDAATAGGSSSVDTSKRTEARAELRFLGFKSESVGIARARSHAKLQIAAANLWSLANSSSYAGDWADELDALQEAILAATGGT